MIVPIHNALGLITLPIFRKGSDFVETIGVADQLLMKLVVGDGGGSHRFV